MDSLSWLLLPLHQHGLGLRFDACGGEAGAGEAAAFGDAVEERRQRLNCGCSVWCQSCAAP